MPKYSQNFLIDQSVLPKIIEAADLNKDDVVIEIGPGKGILTEQLCARSGQVIAIEIDQTLMPGLLLLQEKLPNLKVINADFNTFNWQALIQNKEYKIVANIPYHITGLIIRNIFQPNQSLPAQVVLMVQDEVAKKIAPNDKNQSVPSNLIRCFGQVEYITKVDKSAFSPAPKVDSAIIRVKNIKPLDIDNFDNFFRIVKMGFASRRKTLLNNLTAGLKLDKDDINKIIQLVNIEPTRRAQTLSLEEWKKLYYVIEATQT